MLHDTSCRISGTLALTPERIDLSGRAVMFESLKKRRRGVLSGRAAGAARPLDTLGMVHGIRESQEAGQGEPNEGPRAPIKIR